MVLTALCGFKHVHRSKRYALSCLFPALHLRQDRRVESAQYEPGGLRQGAPPQTPTQLTPGIHKPNKI